MRRNGKIIVFEGCDGVGKETQSKLLQEYLTNKGLKVNFVSFPRYDTKFGNIIHQYLHGNLNLDGFGSQLLYALDRYDYTQTENVKKRLKDGEFFIFDRYVQSAAVYAGAFAKKKRMKAVEKILTLEYGLLNIPEPDITFYLNISDNLNENLLQKCVQETGIAKDAHESNADLMKRVRKLGLKIADTYYNKIIQCDDGERCYTIDKIHDSIRRHIDVLLDLDMPRKV